MANCNDILDILKRDGTGQEQRYTDALNPGYFKLHNLDIADWLLFARRFAGHVHYFDTDNKHSGNWENFFAYFNMDKEDVGIENPLKLKELKENIFRELRTLKNEHSLTPHLTLFICFLKLLEQSSERFNQLTRRHLDFYYREVLKIEKLPPTPDKAYVLFELAKNITREKIPLATALDGGKDTSGKKRIYTTTEEFIANKGVITHLKNIYRDDNAIKYSNIANSYDGQGSDFPEGKAFWYPFGHSYLGEKATARDMHELQDTTLGFAVASPVLELAEGERVVTISITFNEPLPAITGDALKNGMEFYFSGEKKWIGPLFPDENISGVIANNILKCEVTLDKDSEKVTAFDPEVLKENFNTSLPLVKVMFGTGEGSSYALYKKIVGKTIKNTTIDIAVNGIKNAGIENDFGALNPEKPFYPFTTRPVKGSAFTVNYPEAFKKNWKKVRVNIPWKNTPDKFRDLYFAYREDHKYNISHENYLDQLYPPLNIVNTIQNKSNKVFDFTQFKDHNLIVDNDAHFKASVVISDKEEWQDANTSTGNPVTIFEGADGEFETDFEINNLSPFYTPGKNGPLRLILDQSFLHEMFPRIYAIALASDNSNVLIPNEPYTPFADHISIDYTAQAGNEEINMFHITPFGQYEVQNEEGLLPKYCNKAGELYIGVENVEPGQQLSLLFQVLEGSENPEKGSFKGEQKIAWSILGNNEWIPLEDTDILQNGIDNFLRSGIVKFTIPDEATNNNTRFPEGLYWLRARCYKEFDVVCKLIDIHAQAVQAVFDNRGNELSHLNEGLPAGSISKLMERLSSVKSVAQPYSSSGGIPPESDKHYYRRVSERLRHKNRAQALWDNEHMLLQYFPAIYKAKCLNHTRYCSKSNQMYYQSPGHVTLVVIPDIVNQNVFDIYEPRVSTTLLNEMETYINRYNTMHVEARVRNPEYEAVKVSLKVKFRKGFDENFYIKQLKKDITRLLSPWAFDRNVGIEFGLSLHKSVLVNYLEELHYVDYLQDVLLYKNGNIRKNQVSPSHPGAILVSAKDHAVDPNIKTCANPITEVQEPCQP